MDKIISIELEELEYVFNCYKELIEISRKLHHQDENACNYGLTPRQEKMVSKLEERAETIADTLGLKAYHQGDPRGCSLYLITDKMDDTNYNNGIAIY